MIIIIVYENKLLENIKVEIKYHTIYMYKI